MIKSGTNGFHGAAYEFLQNSAFAARSFFNPSVGHLAYNQFGGNIGGPIKRNKIFFFANYLRTMDREANTNQTNIPSNPFRTGDLSGDPGHQVYDPTTGLLDGTGQNREPFPGNIIPASRINPVSKKILTFLPPTNEPFDATSQTNRAVPRTTETSGTGAAQRPRTGASTRPKGPLTLTAIRQKQLGELVRRSLCRSQRSRTTLGEVGPGKRSHASLPCTSAGGLVASTAVKVSITL